MWYNVHLIYLQDGFEDTKVVIHKSKDSKNHGQKKIDNWTNNDLPHYITIYNTFITVDAQNPYYDVVQYHPFDNIET
jgi:hypothetical protein